MIMSNSQLPVFMKCILLINSFHRYIFKSVVRFFPFSACLCKSCPFLIMNKGQFSDFVKWRGEGGVMRWEGVYMCGCN